MKPEAEKILIDMLANAETKIKNPNIGGALHLLRMSASISHMRPTIYENLANLYNVNLDKMISYTVLGIRLEVTPYETIAEQIIKDLLELEKQGKLTILHTKSFEFQYKIEEIKEKKGRIYLEYMIKPYVLNFEKLEPQQKIDIAVNIF